MSDQSPKQHTAQEIFQLLESQNLQQKRGYIEISFADLTIRIKDKSAVGNLLQEWFGLWLKKHKIFYRQKSNTQEFPDFLLHPTSDQEHLLEVKVFDASASPNFDIANFDAYVRSLRTNAYRLSADYLIFAYRLDDGVFRVTNFWLKKIWEISGVMSTRPIRVQEKQGKIVNLRPVIWYSQKPAVTKPFASKTSFLRALRDTLAQTHNATYADTWLLEVNQNLELHFQTNADTVV